MVLKKAINKPKFKNADELRAACVRYFADLGDDEPPTTGGLTLALGFSSHRKPNARAERLCRGARLVQGEGRPLACEPGRWNGLLFSWAAQKKPAGRMERSAGGLD